MTLIKEVNTKILSENELSEMGKIQKDMWAYGLGEYVRCNCCNKIHSKNDIFGHLSYEIKRESVTKLEEIFLGDSIRCKKCDSTNTDFIYDVSTNIEIFRDRYKQKSFLILSYSQSGDIVGFCDGYIDSLENIYKKDLKQHYPNLDLNLLSGKIQDKLLLDSIEDILFFSSLGTYEKNSSLKLAFDLFKNFLKTIKLSDEKIGFTELDRNNPLYFIYQVIGRLSLGISSDNVFNTSACYDSDLCVFPRESLDFFRNNGDYSLKDFLRLIKSKN